MTTRAVLATFALALALPVVLAGACSPNPPTDPSFGDGFFGCATGGCPAALPYCDPVDRRCYAAAPTDAGPRPDVWSMPGTQGPYGECRTIADCQAGLQCLARAGSPAYCIENCPSMAHMCARGGVCAPQYLEMGMGAPLVCLADCAMGPCPGGARERRDPRMMTVCHCVPQDSNW